MLSSRVCALRPRLDELLRWTGTEPALLRLCTNPPAIPRSMSMGLNFSLELLGKEEAAEDDRARWRRSRHARGEYASKGVWEWFGVDEHDQPRDGDDALSEQASEEDGSQAAGASGVGNAGCFGAAAASVRRRR